MKTEHKTKKRMRRSKEELKLEALKYSRKADFKNLSNSHYKQAWRKGPDFLNEICSHMTAEWAPKWTTIEDVKKEALKYKTRTEFARKNSGAYDRAQTMGWLHTVCDFMGEKPNSPWTKEEMAEIALRYKNKEDFRAHHDGVYCAAIKLGREFLDSICSHMQINWEIKWNSFEKIQAEASKYSRRHEFKTNSSGAWDAASNLGIIDKVCSHMKRSHSVSSKEEHLLNAIKKLYPTASTYRDKTVNIPDKKHIKRFDIDIFISELNRGIEFDGTYYHSFAHMRKSSRRTKWSDLDLLNYHEIKDRWFASKGIQILHVKEEDWNLDKEACIKRCLNFLGGSDEQKTA